MNYNHNMVFGYVYGRQQNRLLQKNTWIFAGCFDDHADAAVQCGAHRLMKHIQGFT
jgi:hypothetical protein